MTKEQMDTANSLYNKIGSLQNQKKIWEDAECFNSICVETKAERQIYVSRSYLDFEVIKTLALARIEKELKEAQAEFDKL